MAKNQIAFIGCTQTVVEYESAPPEEQLKAARESAGFISKSLGMSVKDLPDQLRTRFELLGKKLPSQPEPKRRTAKRTPPAAGAGAKAEPKVKAARKKKGEAAI